jgi:hypothetical protein
MTEPDRDRTGVASVTVEHPGTHEPTQAQIDEALKAAGHEGFRVVSSVITSGGPSTLNVEPEPHDPPAEGGDENVPDPVPAKRVAKKAE